MLEDLTPDIRELPIGIRSIKMLRIYPLSIGDQLEMTDLISNILTTIIEKTNSSSLVEGSESNPEGFSFISEIVDLTKTHIRDFLVKVIDTEISPDEVMKDMTNKQVVALARLLYEVNYEETIKNVKDLIMTVREKSPLVRSLQS